MLGEDDGGALGGEVVLRAALGEDDGGALGGDVLRAVVGATTRRRSRGRGAAARSSRGGGAELSVRAARSSGRRRRGGSTAQKAKCWKRGRGEEIYGGCLLSRVELPPGTKGPFIPGRGSTRDKRYFWAGRENS